MDSLTKVETFAPARVNPVLSHHQERRVTLGGTWGFSLDPDDAGVREKWFDRPDRFPSPIRVPGAWQAQGWGNPEPTEIWDYHLQARVLRASYQGPGWYAREFEVPRGWEDRRVWIHFGGVHPSAQVWLDGTLLGTHSAPFVPFALEARDALGTPGSHFLAVRVGEEKRWLGLGWNFHTRWSGFYRPVELTATGPATIQRCWLYPDAAGERLRVVLRVHVAGPPWPPLSAEVRVHPGKKEGRGERGWEGDQKGPKGVKKGVWEQWALDYSPSTWTEGERARKVNAEFELAVPDPLRWSPDAPHLYRVDVVLRADGEVSDALSERVGFWEFTVRGKQMLINGEPTYLRGTGDFCVNPETGSPDPSRIRWRRRLPVLREYGFNYVRFQSMVPCPEYYDVADEVGLIVQSEMGSLGAWKGSHPGEPYQLHPTPERRPHLQWQWEHTVMRDLNHPSAAIYCMSNEYGTHPAFPEVAWECYRATKNLKPGALVLWTDGGYHPDLPADFCNWEAAYDDEVPLPLIQHEFRWWTSIPDVHNRKKYRRGLRPYHIDWLRENAAAAGLTHLLPQMVENSQKLQALERKGKVERCRRDHPQLAGICLWCAVDTHLSCQGVFSDFYTPKSVSAEEYRRSNGDTVVLMNHDFDTRVLVGGTRFHCQFFVSDFSHPPLQEPTLEWELTAPETGLQRGREAFGHQPFRTHSAGAIDIPLPEVATPTALLLKARIADRDRACENQWNFWLFPASVELPTEIGAYRMEGDRILDRYPHLPPVDEAQLASPASPRVVLAEGLTEGLLRYVAGGGRLVIVRGDGLPRHVFDPKLGQDHHYFFTALCHYPPCDQGNCGTIIADHPILGDFPHEGYADLQFFRLISDRAAPIDLTAFAPAKIQPALRALGSPYAHPLDDTAYLFDVGVGAGYMIFCALDLNPDWPEAAYLLALILRYAGSSDLHPGGFLDVAVLEKLVR